MKPNLSVNLCGIKWQNPVTVASGTFGVDWPISKKIEAKKLGAITLKTVTLEPREGHKPPIMTKTTGGMLNAVGLKNPGVKEFLKDDLVKAAKFNAPVIVSFAGKNENEYLELAKILDKESKIDYLEANISCPNVKTGTAIGVEPYAIEKLTRHLKKIIQKPLIIKLTPNVTDIVACAKAAELGGADAISMINTLTGLAINLDRRSFVLTNGTGGLSGSAIKPIALRMVWQVANSVKIPIIGMGGIADAKDALEFMAVGATAVAVGTANFTNPKATATIIKDMEKYLIENKIEDINELRNTLKN